jgi:hypothetical protein
VVPAYRKPWPRSSRPWRATYSSGVQQPECTSTDGGGLPQAYEPTGRARQEIEAQLRWFNLVQRACSYGSEGWGFESLRARRILPGQRLRRPPCCRLAGPEVSLFNIWGPEQLFEHPGDDAKVTGSGVGGRRTC